MVSKDLISEQPNELRNKDDIENDTYGAPVTPLDGSNSTVHHNVVADKLARKLSARQVQMIAIGKMQHSSHSPFIVFEGLEAELMS